MTFCTHAQCRCWFLRTERAAILHRYAHEIADKIERQENPSRADKIKAFRGGLKMKRKAGADANQEPALQIFVTDEEARQRQLKDKNHSHLLNGEEEDDASQNEDDGVEGEEEDPAAKRAKLAEPREPAWAKVAMRDQDLSNIVDKGMQKWDYQPAGWCVEHTY